MSRGRKLESLDDYRKVLQFSMSHYVEASY